MLIKTGSLGAAGKMPHRITKSLGGGKYAVTHPVGCECQILWSVEPAPWISYDMGRGRLFCDHCGLEELLPCPGRRDHIDKKTVWMEPEAVANDLARFRSKHEGCKKTNG